MESKYNYIYDSVWKYVGFELRNLVYNISLQNCKPLIRATLFEQEENIIKHCVFLIYYTIYRERSPKRSIRSHMGSPNKEDNRYENTLYAYRKYRLKKDEQSKEFFGDDNFPSLYKSFCNKPGEKSDSFDGQELSDSAYFELSLETKYDIFDVFFWERICSSKKCSNFDFEDNIFPQINDIYDEIGMAFKNCDMPYFMRSVEYYALEVAYHFEKAYLIAEKLNKLKVKKDIRDKEKDVFGHITMFCDNSHQYQNNLICGYNSIMELYKFPEIDATDIYDIVHCCCRIINKTVSDFLEDNPDYIDWPITKEADELCENFFGKGQHITAKNIENIRIKDFRDFYK